MATAAFFAPLMSISPKSGFPPWITYFVKATTLYSFRRSRFRHKRYPRAGNSPAR